MAEERRRRVTGIDIALTVVLLLVGIFGTGPAAANQHVVAPPLAYVLMVAACLPIAGMAHSATVDARWPPAR